MFKLKLGRQPSPPHKLLRALKMARYRTGISIPFPAYVDWYSAVKHWGMMLNDSLGDCTCAAAGHMVEQWTKLASGTENIVPDSSILTMYEQACGYVPGNPATDQGGDMMTVLDYFRNTGLKDTAGKVHNTLAYISVNPMNPQEVKEAIYLFGNVYCGVNLPNTVLNEENPRDCWSVSPDYKTNPDAQAGSLGGHCIPLVGFSDKAYRLVSWGDIYYMTPNFLQMYCDELYAVVSTDWIEKNNLSPSLFDTAQLMADLEVVTA